MPWYKISEIRGETLILRANNTIHAEVKTKKLFNLPRNEKFFKVEEIFLSVIPIQKIIDDLKGRGYKVT